MAITASRPWEKFSWRKNCRVSFFWVVPISPCNPGQKVLGHSLFFTCFVWNLQLTGNIATSSKLSIYREWTREWAAKPLAFAAPFACCSRVTSRDSPKWSACSQATGNTDHKQGLNKGRDPFNQNFRNFRLKLNGSVRSNRKRFEKRVHLLRWTTFPGRTGWNFGWMDRAQGFSPLPEQRYGPYFGQDLKKSVWLVKPNTVQGEEGLTWTAIFYTWKTKCPKLFVQDCTSQVE